MKILGWALLVWFIICEGLTIYQVVQEGLTGLNIFEFIVYTIGLFIVKDWV